ncbi:MAG TPA: universal stress protein [Polyangia bacterium]|jgi:nucleotide-binding universal stress UspA family protein|nr:universal stress protein [Polyangia bacterium]
MDPRAVKSILVPTDFSDASAEALATAIAFARAFSARVTLIHVFVEPTYVLPPPVEMATFPFDISEIMAKVQTSLDAERQRVEKAGIQVEAETITGRAAPEIVAYAKKIGADLIVMGTHGRSGFQHALLGSVAERVVHHSPCPVLVVPAPRPTAS